MGIHVGLSEKFVLNLSFCSETSPIEAKVLETQCSFLSPALLHRLHFEFFQPLVDLFDL